jgi:DNA-binding NtrC family response regulator
MVKAFCFYTDAGIKNRRRRRRRNSLSNEMIYLDKVYNGQKRDRDKTIMICDDEEELLSLFESVLKRSYNVVTASSGKECIEKYKQNQSRGESIDLLILDYWLGDTFGDKVAKSIKKMDGTKILLITAYEIEDSLIRHLKDEGFVIGILKKPFSIRSLMDLIVQVLN